MYDQLKPGTVLTSPCGSYTVQRLLGSGGQGEVYEVESGGTRYALKWYFKKTATSEQKRILEDLIKKGSPDPCFLWPQDLIEQRPGEPFGYIMALRPQNFKGIVDLMKRRANPTFATLCRAAYNMTLAYEKLHIMGYCYKDISFQNTFFDPDTGNVLICDVDNVVPSGIDMYTIRGTEGFMAPEIIRGEAAPSRETDQFSLPVLMFHMFMMEHPLHGRLEYNIKCLDAPAKEQLYGKNPVFSYDPNNDSNRPVPGYHDNVIVFWNNVYPQLLKDLFIRSFTVGLHEPNRRVTEKEWLRALVNLISGIFPCPKCGCELFYDEKKDNHTCWCCGQTISKPAALVIDKNRIVLWRGMKVYAHHINGDYDMTTVVGTASQNPQDPKQRGIRNESTEIWTYIRADGTQVQVAPGKSAAIVKGAQVSFGQVTGKFE